MRIVFNFISVVIIFLAGFAGGFFCAKYNVRHVQPQIKKLTILEVEQVHPIEILAPTVRELQRHANRHGADLAEDNIYGPDTACQLDSVRCNQMCVLITEKMVR